MPEDCAGTHVGLMTLLFRGSNPRSGKMFDKFINLTFSRILSPIMSSFRSIFSIRWQKWFFLDFLSNHVIYYPTPISLTYAWSFGSLAGVCLVIQIISGVVLSMFYTPHVDLAFSSVEYIMRDVTNGWFIRYTHANGASMFFLVVYCHIFRGFYYGSYMRPRQALWCSGVVLFLLMMGTAFTGYVLPWGQMSFWGATVITSMVTAIPYIGQEIVHWLWGGYVVGNLTLKRFYTIHFVLPFVIAGLTLIHLALLHKDGSNNPLGTDSSGEEVPFYPYFFVKDLFAFFCFLAVFGYFVIYCPNVLNHPDNYIPADPLHTPPHVVPEWYFLPFYTILRSIPHKVGGIILMVGAILVWFLIPFTNTSIIRSTTFRPIFKIFFWILVADFAVLFWVGQRPVKDHYSFVGLVGTFYYYLFFVILVPLIGKVEWELLVYDE